MTHSDAGSPPSVVVGGGGATQGKCGRLGVPLSERQQLALIMQQYGKSDVSSAGGEHSDACTVSYMLYMSLRTWMARFVHKHSWDVDAEQAVSTPYGSLLPTTRFIKVVNVQHLQILHFGIVDS